METQEPQKKVHQLATVQNVYSDGITLIFDGETIASTKRYKRNASVTFSTGDRVKVCAISGTYLVEYPIR